MNEARIGIIGGGLVGLSLALALAKISDIRIDIFEAKSSPGSFQSGDVEYSAQYDARSLALASGSVEVLKRMGIWEKIRPHTALIKDIQVSRQGAWGQTHISALEEGVEALGYVVETPHLALFMLAEVEKKASITLHWNAQIERLVPGKSGYQICWSEGSQSEKSQNKTLVNKHLQETGVDLLIIADGEHSSSCAHLGIRHFKTHYDQSAIVGNIDLAEPLKGKAIERFTDSGVLAILPLDTQKDDYSRRAAFVWALSASDAQRKFSSVSENFKFHLENALGRRFGIHSLGHLSIYPLSSNQAEEIIRPQLLVMGNAAHALHPVAAQGFNLSLRDIAFILDMADYAQKNNISVGDFGLLVQYQQQRHNDQQRVRWFINGLIKAYAGSGGMNPGLQSLGLFLFDVLPGSKGSLARFAMGARQVEKFEFSH